MHATAASRGEDSAPRLARVKKERNDRTGKLLKYASRFYNFGASVMKMAPAIRSRGTSDIRPSSAPVR